MEIRRWIFETILFTDKISMSYRLLINIHISNCLSNIPVFFLLSKRYVQFQINARDPAFFLRSGCKSNNFITDIRANLSYHSLPSSLLSVETCCSCPSPFASSSDFSVVSFFPSVPSPIDFSSFDSSRFSFDSSIFSSDSSIFSIEPLSSPETFSISSSSASTNVTSFFSSSYTY